MAWLLKAIMGSGATALVATAGLAAFTTWNGKRAEQLVPPEGQFTDVKGGRLHYWVKARRSFWFTVLAVSCATSPMP